MTYPPGRTDELASLLQCVARSADGQPQVVLVSAATALGRTELLQSFVSHCAEAGAAVRQTCGTEDLRDVPYALIDRVGVLAGEPDSAQSAASALQSQLRAAAGDSVAVVCVDDLHLADRESWRVFMHLVRMTTYEPIMVVGTMDSTVTPAYPRLLAEITGHQGFVPLQLNLLDVDGIAEVLGERHDAATARRLAPGFEQHTGGNPLLVRALLEDTVDPDHLLLEPGDTFLCALVAISMRWDAVTTAVAQALAVLGDTAGGVDLVGLLGLGEGEVLHGVSTLRAIGLVDDGAALRRSVRPAMLWSTSEETHADLVRRAPEHTRTIAPSGPSVTDATVSVESSADRAETVLSSVTLRADTLPAITDALAALADAGRNAAVAQWRQVFLVEARALGDSRAEQTLAAVPVESLTTHHSHAAVLAR